MLLTDSEVNEMRLKWRLGRIEDLSSPSSNSSPPRPILKSQTNPNPKFLTMGHHRTPQKSFGHEEAKCMPQGVN